MWCTLRKHAARAAICAVMFACNRGDKSHLAAKTADSTASPSATASYTSPYSQEEAALIGTLARAAGGSDGQQYQSLESNTPTVTVSGSIEADPSIAGDSIVDPSQALGDCRRFRDEFMPRRNRGVGNAIVWLTGVARGKTDELPRRTALRVSDCTLDPRVHVIARGGTVIVGSSDAMESRIRLHDALGDPAQPRALIPLNDFGQVVPTPAVAAIAGLVEVRDDLHPWIRGYIAVSPHPYVEITDASGSFRFEQVPAGSYRVVVFSERLGVMSQAITVGASDLSLSLSFK